MLLFKNTVDTLEQVIANGKHASDSIPRKVNQGDIILISQTYNTLKKDALLFIRRR